MSNRRNTTLLVTLVLVLSIGAWFLLRGPASSVVNNSTHVVNSNARGYATDAVDAVVEAATVTSSAQGGTGMLTKANLAAAIANAAPGVAVGGVPAVVLRTVSGSHATFTVNTPQEKNICAWVPLSYKGTLYSWPVHFC